MRLFKLIVALVVIGLIGIFIYQNMQTWMQSVSFTFNLYLVKASPATKLYLIILISLLVGFLAGLTVILKFHFKTRRQLKRERQEKQQVQAASAQKQTGAESAGPSVPDAPGA